MLICFTFVICFCPFWGALPFPFLSIPLDKLCLGFLLPFCGALPLLVGWSIPVVNGVVVISSTFVAVLVIFVYLCKFMDSRSGCDCIGPCFAL